MKHIALLFTVAIMIASCSNGSFDQNTTTDTTTTTSIDTTQHTMANNPEDMVTDGSVDTNGHILKNGKVREGNDKVLSGDVEKADSTK
jgi:hypothetical protein